MSRRTIKSVVKYYILHIIIFETIVVVVVVLLKKKKELIIYFIKKLLKLKIIYLFASLYVVFDKNNNIIYWL